MTRDACYRCTADTTHVVLTGTKEAKNRAVHRCCAQHATELAKARPGANGATGPQLTSTAARGATGGASEAL
jgi:hypothetical protein